MRTSSEWCCSVRTAVSPRMVVLLVVSLFVGMASGCALPHRCVNTRCSGPLDAADRVDVVDVIDVRTDITIDVGMDIPDDGLIEDVTDAPVCEAGTTLCNDRCVDTNSDPEHCGSCGNACSLPNASAMCMAGRCVLGSCNSGFDNCDSNSANGCETNLNTSVMHCGGCGNACTMPANATATCTMGMCGFSCNAGWGNCDGNATNGCETDLNTSASNCGMCGRVCTAPANATATCTSGTCGFQCNDGYMRSGDACIAVPAPRPIAPLSTALVTSQQPRLRWVLAMGTDGARVELCRDRAMTRDCQTIDAMGTSTTPPSPLMPGVWFWRLRGRAGGSTGTATSPVWQFTVGARSAPVNTSWGTVLDVNGDGYSDVLVGAPNANSGAGRVYLFPGGATGLNSSPAVSLDGPMGSAFGKSVASAGDVNGDGYADVLVGAPNANSGAGRVYLFPGGATGLNSSPAVSLDGSMGNAFGTSVASAGDVNGDGYADVVVGAPNANTVRLYLGSASGLRTSTPVSITGSMGDGWFGWSVASAGDVNGDGYADVAVGAPNTNSYRGRVRLYLGNDMGLSTTRVQSFDGPDGNLTYFGYSVAGAGDVNGDGFADVIVGAVGWNMESGRLYLYLGSSSGLAARPTNTLDGPRPAGRLGESLASAGDVNGDGFADVVAGAPNDSRNPSAPSHAYVYLGSMSGLSATRSTTLDGSTLGNGNFGFSVASALETNSDGTTAMLSGAPRSRSATSWVQMVLEERGRLPLAVSQPTDAVALTSTLVTPRQVGARPLRSNTTSPQFKSLPIPSQDIAWRSVGVL